MTPMLPFLLALIAAFTVDWASEHRGLLPPGFRLESKDEGGSGLAGALRRGLAFSGLVLVFWLGVFAPLGELGREIPLDLAGIPTWQLFLMHIVLLWGTTFWLGLGHPLVRGRVGEIVGGLAAQLGLKAERPWREVGIGLAGGVVAWVMVIVSVLALAGVISVLGAEDLLPTTPPDFILWVISLPVALRLALSLSAGVVEEIFFRGFLQRRIGLGLSSFFFVVAHVNYGQPLMLVGVALLSIFFGLLVIWRRNIWAAVVAHFLFDAIQLVIVIPKTVDWIPEEGAIESLTGALLVGLS